MSEYQLGFEGGMIQGDRDLLEIQLLATLRPEANVAEARTYFRLCLYHMTRERLQKLAVDLVTAKTVEDLGLEQWDRR